MAVNSWVMLLQLSPPIRLHEDNVHQCQTEKIKQKVQK